MRDKIKRTLKQYDIKDDHFESVLTHMVDLANDYKWKEVNLDSEVYYHIKDYFMGEVKYKKMGGKSWIN